jgi:hypothetical protein
MISVESIIAAISGLRLAWMQDAVQQPNVEHAAFAYGQAAGRDQAASLILEKIDEMLAADDKEDEDGS